MDVLVKGKLIDVDFENWEFEGKKGTRYFATIKDENKRLVTFKISDNSYATLIDSVGEDMEIVCSIFITGSYKLTMRDK